MLSGASRHTSRVSQTQLVIRMAWAMALGLGALLWHGQWSLTGLTLGTAALAVAVGAHRHSWKRIGLVFIWQVVLVMALYLLRYGTERLPDGALVAYRLVLLVLPGVLLMKTTHHGDMARLLVRFLPARVGFVLSTCVFFFPTLWNVTVQTYESQVLRGARILPRELINPVNMITLVRVICLPAIVSSLALAKDIALAAHCRWYGLHPDRTVWPGPDPSTSNGEPRA
jgi:energy-coupling factor transport system permease protein